MACACFEPKTPLPWPTWPGKYRPPLGRPYRGICRATLEEPFEPEGGLLVMGCNLGYARGECRRLPEDAPDAVRFCLLPSGSVRWTLERSHLPEDHGNASRGVPTGRGPVLDSQVEAYFRACEQAEDRFD